MFLCVRGLVEVDSCPGRVGVPARKEPESGRALKVKTTMGNPSPPKNQRSQVHRVESHAACSKRSNFAQRRIDAFGAVPPVDAAVLSSIHEADDATAQNNRTRQPALEHRINISSFRSVSLAHWIRFSGNFPDGSLKGECRSFSGLSVSMARAGTLSGTRTCSTALKAP